MLKYTEDHEWLRAEGDEIVIGITAHAAEQLGDVVFIELPQVGRELARGDAAVVIESVKAASEISAPVAGTVTAVNDALATDPGAVNTDAMAAWFFRIKADAAQLEGLMDEAAYMAMIG